MYLVAQAATQPAELLEKAAKGGKAASKNRTPALPQHANYAPIVDAGGNGFRSVAVQQAYEQMVIRYREQLAKMVKDLNAELDRIAQ